MKVVYLPNLTCQAITENMFPSEPQVATTFREDKALWFLMPISITNNIIPVCR